MPDIEKDLESLRHKIPVNQELKQSLRKRFVSQARSKKRLWRWIPAGVAAAIVAIIVGVLSGLPGVPLHTALAAELQILEQYSFLDLTSGDHGLPAVSGDALYLPLTGEGIYLLDSIAVRSGEGLTLVLKDSTVTSVAASRDGSKLAYVTDSGVFSYDMATGQVSAIYQPQEPGISFASPVWTPDGKQLMLTRTTDGATPADDIVLVSVSNGALTKVTQGSQASMAPDQSYILFVRDGHLYQHVLIAESPIPFKGLKPGQERLLGEGSFPSISPDGRFVAYVRADESGVANVYVANTANLSDERKITSNLAYALSASQQGFYDYHGVVWIETSDQLYVLRSSQTEQHMRLMRIQLADKDDLDVANKGRYTLVSQYLEALVNRDFDVARLLYSEEVIDLSVSAPRPTGFAFPQVNEDTDATEIEAVLYLTKPGEPYYRQLTLQFETRKLTSGHEISSVSVLAESTLYVQGRIIYRDGQQVLSLAEEPGTLGPIAFDAQDNKLYYTVYNEGSAVIRSYDLGNNQSSLVYSFSGDVIVTSLGVNGNMDREEGFLAINFTADGEERGLLYSLQWAQPVQIMGRVNRIFWSNDTLLCYTENGGTLVRWLYNPITGHSRI